MKPTLLPLSRVLIRGGENKVSVVKRINRGSRAIPLVAAQTLHPISKVIVPRNITSPACAIPVIEPRKWGIKKGIKLAAGYGFPYSSQGLG
jgi:hypothetical protein